MNPRPSSPTSLLWAHQIKRENGHLLGRIQTLESANKQHDNRLKAAEGASTQQASADLDALAEQVKACDSKGVTRRMEEVEKRVMAKLDDVQTNSEAVTVKMSTFEKDEAAAGEERRNAFTKEKALLKRVGEMEEGMRKYQESLNQVGRRVEEGSIAAIRAQLEGLSAQAEKEGADMRLMEDSIQALELANAELRKANARLTAEIQEVAKKAANEHAPVMAQAAPAAARNPAARTAASKRKAPEPTQEPPESDSDGDDDDAWGEALNSQPPRKKQKSHKWAGGGADKDIISQAAQAKLTPQRERGSASQSERKKPAATKPKSAAKQAAPARPTAPTKLAVPAKPAPLTKKAAGKAVAQGVSRPGTKTKQSQRQTRRHADGDPDRPIIRAGKGWIEVAVTPSQESEEERPEVELAKRLTGRARRLRPSDDNVDAQKTTVQRPIRGARSQAPATQKPTAGRRRQAEPDAIAGAQKYKPSGAMRATKAAQNQKLDGDGVLRSPTHSPHATERRRDTHDYLLDAVVTSQTELAAERQPPSGTRRRVIEQVDDISVLQQYASE